MIYELTRRFFSASSSAENFQFDKKNLLFIYNQCCYTYTLQIELQYLELDASRRNNKRKRINFEINLSNLDFLNLKKIVIPTLVKYQNLGKTDIRNAVLKKVFHT